MMFYFCVAASCVANDAVGIFWIIVFGINHRFVLHMAAMKMAGEVLSGDGRGQISQNPQNDSKTNHTLDTYLRKGKG